MIIAAESLSYCVTVCRQLIIDRRNDNATLYFDIYSIPKIIIT